MCERRSCPDEADLVAVEHARWERQERGEIAPATAGCSPDTAHPETWLETCVRQVITLPLDAITAETGRLLANIKTAKLDPADARGATAFRQDPSRYGTDWVSGLIPTFLFTRLLSERALEPQYAVEQADPVGDGEGGEPQGHGDEADGEDVGVARGEPEVVVEGGDEQHGGEHDQQRDDQEGRAPVAGVQAAKNRLGGNRNRINRNEAR